MSGCFYHKRPAAEGTVKDPERPLDAQALNPEGRLLGVGCVHFATARHTAILPAYPSHRPPVGPARSAARVTNHREKVGL